MRHKYLIILSIVACAAFFCSPTAGFASLLGSADNFAVLAGQTVTNTGNTVIYGDIGVWPGSAYTGYGTVTQTGSVYLGGPATGVSGTAQGDVTTAYNSLAGMAYLPGNHYIVPTDLGGMTLASGVYHFDSSAGLTGTLSLDAGGFSNQVWVFQMGSTLITAPSAAVQWVNAGSNNIVYWQVGSSATIDTGTAFEGNILALTSIALNTGATLNGRALARNGEVTMQGNTINNGFGGGPPGPSAIPEPSTILLLGLGGAATAFIRRRRRA